MNMTKTQKIYHEDVQFLAKVISELSDAAAVALAEGDVVAAREHLAHLGAMAVRHMSVGLLKETGDLEFHPSLRALDDLLPFDLEF